MKYTVSAGGKDLEVEVEGDAVKVGGRSYRAELRRIEGTPLRILVLDGTSLTLSLGPLGKGVWVVGHQGERQELLVLDERTRHIRSLVGGGQIHAGPPTLKAPMPGLVVRVLVTPGQQVAAGASLVVLEAMKMENELKASGPGIVDAVPAVVGQTVERGQELVRFRPIAA